MAVLPEPGSFTISYYSWGKVLVFFTGLSNFHAEPMANPEFDSIAVGGPCYNQGKPTQRQRSTNHGTTTLRIFMLVLPQIDLPVSLPTISSQIVFLV